MSHFLIYAARLQDAGVEWLSVRLHTREDRTRMMRVTPHGSYPQSVIDRWPWRDFELCGTDRVLEDLEDGMAYSDDGPTPEKVQAAIDAHPHLRDDLTSWYADWLLSDHSMPTDEELATVEVDEAAVQRTAQWVKGVMRGMDIVRGQKAAKATEGAP